MAPGCFSHSSSNKDSTTHEQLSAASSDTLTSSATTQIPVLVLKKQLTTTTTSNNVDANITMSKEAPIHLIDRLNFGLDSYVAAEINLDQIPLPASPPPALPSQPMANTLALKQSSQEGNSCLGNVKSLKGLKNSSSCNGKVEKKPNHLLIFDTVDSFEILEQTIMKQKRLTKLKNTDLRRKILLKRTFDLVCEIMDAENGFNDDDDDDDDDDDEEEETTQNNLSSAIEIELHDTSKMDEDEEVTTTTRDEETTTTTTLVKLNDVGETDLEMWESLSQAQVPSNKRRRASMEEDDDDEDEDENNLEASLEESYFYEFSMSFLMNDQQLNYKRPNAPEMGEEVTLNIYQDTLVDIKSSSTNRTSRSHHKKLKN